MNSGNLLKDVFYRILAQRRWLWKNLMVAFIVMLLTGSAWWYIGMTYQGRIIAEQRSEMENKASNISSLLISNINRRQAQLVGLAAAIRSHTVTELRDKHFNIFAAGLSADDPVIRTIQFFPPNGEVLVYPIKGNEAVSGYTLNDLMNTDRANVRADVKRAMETRKISLSSPYELRQGGKGVVERLAVYEEEKFLGLATIILDLDSLLAVPGLDRDSSEIHFTIWDSQGNIFFGEKKSYPINPVLKTIVLPEGYWTLSATPIRGWEAESMPEMISFWVIGGLLTALVGALTYLVSSGQTTLMQAVAERTAELAVSEERYSTALKMVNEGVWDWNIETNVGHASENTYILLGLDSKILKPNAETLLKNVHPDDLQRVNNEIQRGVESSEGFNIEMLTRSTDGGWAHTLLRGRVVEMNTSGQAKRLAGTISDITEQKQAQARLFEEQAKFQALFENNHAPMMLVRPEDGQIIHANPAACTFYGWTREELLMKKVSQINTLTEAEVLAEIKLALFEERRFFQFRHRLANQEIRDVEVFSGPIQSEGKTLLYSIIHDVTARKLAERALAESEERYRQLLMMAPIGIVVHAEGIIQFVNPAGARLLGATSVDQIIGKHMAEFFPPEYLQEANSILEKILKNGSSGYSVEQVLIMLDGTRIDTEATVAAVVYQGKLAFQSIITDITERKKGEEQIHATQAELQRLLAAADESRLVLLSVIEDQKIAEEKLGQLNTQLEQRVAERTAQLEAANKELEAFSYSVSHDLRAPLRGIDGWSLALWEDFGPQLDEKGRQYIERVRNDSQRMGILIDDLLRLSRVARTEMKRRDVVLSVIAEKIAARLEEENSERAVKVIIQPGVCGQGDPQLLEIVLTNLLSNAFKFTSKQPLACIEFGQEEQDGCMVYFVRDNGAGFEMAFAKNLFGAFQRMHKQSEFPGTGIGLATVQRIINRHGGKVWANAIKNQGATFYFTLLEER